jgi:iron(III) transport system permease protein
LISPFIVRNRLLKKLKIPDRWSFFTLALAVIFSIPVFAVLGMAIVPREEMWSHLFATVLPESIFNTVALMLGVGFGTFVLGVSTAWFVTMFTFPGKKIFEWALFLPMAVPAYIIATVYVQIFEYAGPVQIALRKWFGWQTMRDYWFPDIVSLEGAIVVITLVLYPYVYLLVRTAFLNQSLSILEASRSLGHGTWKTFWSVALPLARPSIAVALSLVMMEAAGDFGTVKLFSVSTFTKEIYSVWLNEHDRYAAAQLSISLLGFILVLVVLERYSRRQQKYFQPTRGFRRPQPAQLYGIKAYLVSAVCFFPVLVGFLLPFTLLVQWSFETMNKTLTSRFLEDAGNSLLLAGITSFLCLILGLMMAYGNRLSQHPLVKGATRIATLGYAIPGQVVALGVLFPFAWFDNTLDSYMRDTFNISTGLLLSGTVVAIIFAYLVRFLSLSYGAIDSGLGKITKSMDDASNSLGKNSIHTLKDVHFPLLRGSILTACIMVFVDVMKELPATLMLQPFNFSTLATRVYAYASDEALRESSLWSVAIVIFGVIPVIILSRAISKTES